MSESKKCLIEHAKLAEQVERYDDMATNMKKVIEMTPVLSDEERSLLAVSHQKVIERRLIAWRILKGIVQKAEGNEERQQMTKLYYEKVETELKSILADVLALLNKLLIQAEITHNGGSVYLDMRAYVYTCIAEVEGICYIGRLAEKDLQTIFKHLPPFERLLASEVCVKWRNLSEAEWKDVSHLDLSQLPTEHIHAMIRKCPKLASVSALRQNLGDLCCFFSRLNVETSLKCVGCDFTSPHPTDHERMYACLRSSQLRELIWHSSRTVWFDYPVGEYEYLMPASLPPTLRRLELVALDRSIRVFDDDAFELPLLESVIFASLSMPESETFMDAGTDFLQTWPGVGALECLHASVNLREAYLDTPLASESAEFVFALAMLEVLFVNNITFMQAHVERLMLQHRSLRVLVLTASRASDFDGEAVIPVRKRFPNGFHADPVPQLQLFLGKIASQRLRFTPSESDALKIYPIDAPLPQFLEKDGVKSTFEGSWIASRIRELAENGERLVDYFFEGNAEAILYTQ